LAAKRTLDGALRFDLYPARLLGDSAYGSAEMLGWLVYAHGIEPHVTVFDKSARQDGTFSRDDFTYDHAGDVYYCPSGKMLTTTGSRVNDEATLRYRASKYDCQACYLKSRCCPKGPARYVPRSIHEGARDMARQIASSWEPFAVTELIARTKALLRRPGGALGTTLVAGNVIFDTIARDARIGDLPLLMPRRESAILEHLMRRLGRVVPKETLEDKLYGLDNELGTNAIPVHVHHLRRRLMDAGARAEIHTVRGVGYLLTEVKG
jgi:hypothetical protein